MANRVLLCIVNGKIQVLPDGDTGIDAGGNTVGGGTPATYDVIDCSANPNYPAANKGDTYKVTVAGKIGGASGVTVEAGDAIMCFVNSSASGDHATVGSNWVILNENILDSLAATRKKYVFAGKFYLDGQNQLSAAMVTDICCPVAGELVAHSIKGASARTAGTLTATPHINGTALPTYTGLNLTIDGTDTTKDSVEVAYDAHNDCHVAAGDTIGSIVTTSTFAPLSNVYEVVIVVEG